MFEILDCDQAYKYFIKVMDERLKKQRISMAEYYRIVESTEFLNIIPGVN